MLNQAAPLDGIFHALADSTRRAMVERLSRGPASVSELAEPLAISLPAVLQHLQVLEGSGLVRSEKAGRVRTCRIDPAALRPRIKDGLVCSWRGTTLACTAPSRPGGLRMAESTLDPTFYRSAAEAAAAPEEQLAYVVALIARERRTMR